MTATAGTPRLLLSTSEVAHALGVSERFVKNLTASGTLPSFKVGRLRRVYAGDLDAWIEGQRAAGSPIVVEERR